jgi:ubiquinone/menaquinone biosynthesis C-methylase UbiE
VVAAEANMLNLPFDDQSFDVVIEKGAMVGNSTSLLQSL